MTDIKKTEDDVLDYTQSVREDVVKKLTKEGMPGDIKDIHAILAALDGMDRAALAKKKIQAESDNMSKAAVAGAAITELLSSLRKENNKSEPIGEASPEQTRIPDHIEAPQVVPGELGDADRAVCYDNLMQEEKA